MIDRGGRLIRNVIPLTTAMTDRFEFDTLEWALGNLPYFRDLGFFADLTDRSNVEILNEIQRRYVEAEGFPYKRLGKTPPPWQIQIAPPFADLSLLQYDYSRIWWEDTECVYPPEKLAYQDAVTRWAAISRGVFAPTAINETWGGTEDEPDSPTVRITLHTGTLTLQPLHEDDWFDLTTLVSINHCIRDENLRFELYEPFDQTAFVLALAPYEKDELRKTRGWQFHKFNDTLTPTW